MATLIKESFGLIYNETFTENSLLWSLTPSGIDCIRYDWDGLKILHNNHYITYTFQEPKEWGNEYCLLAEIDHKLTNEKDIAGMIVLVDTNNYAEFQSYLAENASTIGNNGENVSAGYDLSAKYVLYRFDNDGEEGESEHEGSPSSETVINPTNGYPDVAYHFMKIIKHNNNVNYTYRFLASIDGTEWIEVGNADYDRSASIGFFLYGTKDQEVLNTGHFGVRSLIVYKNNIITIRNINILYAVEFIDTRYNRVLFRSDSTPGQNFINHGNNTIEINTTMLNVPILSTKIRIYSKGALNYDYTIAEYDLGDMYGGDVFSINYDLKLYIDDQLIDKDQIYDLGTLYTDYIRKNIYIYNDEDFDLTGIKVSIIGFSEYYNGEEVVKIAEYEETKEIRPQTYQYSDSIIIDRLNSHESFNIVMKLSDVPKQEFYSVANKYRFKLLVSFISPEDYVETE